MSLAKTFRRRKKRVATRHARGVTNRHTPPQELVDNPSNVTVRTNEQAGETVGPDEISFEATELLDSLMQFTGGENESPSLQSIAVPDNSTRLQAVDNSVSSNKTGTLAEGEETEKDLVDSSTWFVDDGGDRFEEFTDDYHMGPNEEEFSDFAFTPVSETTPSEETLACEETLEDVYVIDSSILGDAAEMSDQIGDSDPVRVTQPVQDERREQDRKEVSQLVWVEYFDSSMQCVGKEAARTENVGDRGMRVCVKAAPSGIERIRVSYPYRGFESYAIIRNRYADQDGQDRLCLEFVDKEWKAHTATAPVENSADQVRPRRILFAEDDPAFRKIIGNILTRAGYDVVLAEDGESAVEKAASEKPDLVITDGLMPKLHGFLVCKAIKELESPPRVIMLTAVYTNPAYTWEARTTFGADDIITKPCEIAHLLRQIEKHMPSQPQQGL